MRVAEVGPAAGRCGGRRERGAVPAPVLAGPRSVRSPGGRPRGSGAKARSVAVCAADEGLRVQKATTQRAGQAGILGRLGRMVTEKGKRDWERLTKGTSATRENLKVIDELLLFYNLEESEGVLEELEELLLVSDFGPTTAVKVVDGIRQEVLDGVHKDGKAIRTALKASILNVLTQQFAEGEEALWPETMTGEGRTRVAMVVGVNGGGKTTSIGKLAHRLTGDGNTVVVGACDTFRAAAVEQLKVWSDRSGAEFVFDADAQKPSAVLFKAAEIAHEKEATVLLADTSGRLQNKKNLMLELEKMDKALDKSPLANCQREILLVLDATTGLNMLSQAREFSKCVDVTGIILTKLDSTARGGCVVSVVDEMGIPVKYVGVGEGIDDMQPFDPEGFVDALFDETLIT